MLAKKLILMPRVYTGEDTAISLLPLLLVAAEQAGEYRYMAEPSEQNMIHGTTLGW